MKTFMKVALFGVGGFLAWEWWRQNAAAGSAGSSTSGAAAGSGEVTPPPVTAGGSNYQPGVAVHVQPVVVGAPPGRRFYMSRALAGYAPGPQPWQRGY